MNKFMHKDNPCKRDCAERSPTCHAKCERYLEWVESRKPELEAKAAKQTAENNYIGYVKARDARFKKRYGRK